MGQYWHAVNLDKKECIHPHALGSGLKLWEQVANEPGVGAALIILCAAMPEQRGGGDLDLDSNWHGPERIFPRDNISPGPMPTDYQEIAHQVIGRWAGDRIALIGDYAEDSDLAPEHKASTIYARCFIDGYDRPSKYWKDDPEEQKQKEIEQDDWTDAELYRDITPLVAKVIEHELQGKYTGTGWKRWKTNEQIEKEVFEATAKAKGEALSAR